MLISTQVGNTSFQMSPKESDHVELHLRRYNRSNHVTRLIVIATHFAFQENERRKQYTLHKSLQDAKIMWFSLLGT